MSDSVEERIRSGYARFNAGERIPTLEIRTSRNRAFVWVRFSGQGAGSSVPIDMEMAHVVTVDDGKIRRIEEYFNRDEALEVAGLSE